MPVISKFYGILIRMYFDDHAPPHFHAVYGDNEIQVGISPIKILQGNVPKRVQSMVLEWAALHQDELITDWERCHNAQAHLPLDPLFLLTVSTLLS